MFCCDSVQLNIIIWTVPYQNARRKRGNAQHDTKLTSSWYLTKTFDRYVISTLHTQFTSSTHFNGRWVVGALYKTIFSSMMRRTGILFSSFPNNKKERLFEDQNWLYPCCRKRRAQTLLVSRYSRKHFWNSDEAIFSRNTSYETQLDAWGVRYRVV